MHLLDNRGAVLIFPIIDARDERFAAQFLARRALIAQQSFDFDLRGDARVIGAGHDQSRLALHAMKARQTIVNRVLEGVTQMQNAGHVGRRNRDDKRARLRVGRVSGRCIEVGALAEFLVEPNLAPLGFDGTRIEGARHRIGGLILRGHDVR